ncbi:hypothetical protein GF415_00425 [Candidatus Micrarchaeota archaeon]|nr:hypothetical protein [Candidatus Micrarchaeota archaeon]
MTITKASQITCSRRKQDKPRMASRRFPHKREPSPPPLHPGSFGDSNPKLTRKELGDNAKEDYPHLSPWRIPPNNMP